MTDPATLHEFIGAEVNTAFAAAAQEFVRRFPTPEAEREGKDTYEFIYLDTIMYALTALTVVGARTQRGLARDVVIETDLIRRAIREYVGILRLLAVTL